MYSSSGLTTEEKILEEEKKPAINKKAIHRDKKDVGFNSFTDLTSSKG